MKKLDMAINAGLLIVLIAFFLNMPEEGYLQFVDLRPIAETELAKVVGGDTQDCLTIPSQTKVVPMSQALKLEGKTTRQLLSEWPNYFCEGKKGATRYIKYATDAGNTLYVEINKSLDEPIRYGFDTPTEGGSAPETKAGGSLKGIPDNLPREPRSKAKPLEKR